MKLVGKRNRFLEYVVSWSLAALLVLTAWEAVVADTDAVALRMCSEPWRWKTLAVSLLLYAAFLGVTTCFCRDAVAKREDDSDEEDD